MKKLTEAEKMDITMRAWDHDYSCRCDLCKAAWVLVGPDGGEPGKFGPFHKDEIFVMAKQMGEPYPEGFDDIREDELGDEFEPGF